MKIRLLRKVRKRFKIYHHLNGFVFENLEIDLYFKLTDTKYFDGYFKTKEEANEAILKRLRFEYQHLGKLGRKFKRK